MGSIIITMNKIWDEDHPNKKPYRNLLENTTPQRNLQKLW